VALAHLRTGRQKERHRGEVGVRPASLGDWAGAGADRGIERGATARIDSKLLL